MPKHRLTSLRRSTRGAVAVEFIIAFMPLMTSFLCFTQLAYAYTAGLVMRHATTVIARYASVAEGCVPHPKEAAEGEGDRKYLAAANSALGPWKGKVSVDQVDVSYPGGSGTACTKPFGEVSTRVRFTYRCSVPLGRNIVCGGGALHKEIQAVSPNHGACYSVGSSGGNCGGEGSGY